LKSENNLSGALALVAILFVFSTGFCLTACQRAGDSPAADKVVVADTPLEERALKLCRSFDRNEFSGQTDRYQPKELYKFISDMVASESFKKTLKKNFPKWVVLEDEILTDRIWLAWSEPPPGKPFRHVVCGDFFNDPQSRVKWSMIGSGGLHWRPRYERLMEEGVLCPVRDLNAFNRYPRDASLLQYRVIGGAADDCKPVGGWDVDQSLEELLLLGWETYTWVCLDKSKPEVVRDFRSKMSTYDYDMVVVCSKDLELGHKQLVTIYPNSATFVPKHCGQCIKK